MSLAANESFLLKIDKRTIWDRSANRLNQVGSIGNTIIGASVDPDRPDLGYSDAQSIFYHSITGDDGNPGTRASPKKTVEACNPFVNETTIFQVVKLDSQDESFGVISKRLQADNGITPKIIKKSNWVLKTSAPSFTLGVRGIAWQSLSIRYLMISGSQIQVVLGSGDAFFLIPNASGWSEQNLSIAYGGGKFVIGGSDGNFQVSIDGGSTWTKITGGFGSAKMESLVYSDSLGLWVCIGQDSNNAAIVTSPDATTWTTRTKANNAIGNIAWGSDRFVIAAGANNLIQWSTNGIEWVAATGAFTGILAGNGIAYNEASELFVAIGGGTSGGNAYEIQISPDGADWELRTKPAGWTTGKMDSIFFDSVINRMTIVGQGGRIATSSSGTSWTFDDGSATAVNLVVAGGGDGVIFTNAESKDVQVATELTNINADLSGFILDGLVVELDALLKNCTLDGGSFKLKNNFKLLNNNGSGITITGKPSKPGMLISTCEFLFTSMVIQLLSVDDFTIENCKLQSNGITVILGGSGIAVSIFIKNNLIISAPNNDALALVGYAADAVSYLVSHNTIIGNVSVANDGGLVSNFEKFRDNIIELHTIFSAIQNVLVESGNVRGGALSGVTLAPAVSIIDPLFKIDPPDYELRRLSEGELSDSPLIGKSVFETYLHLGNPFPRDLGAYNLNNENTSTKFLSGMPMPKPKNGGILHEIRNSFNFNIPKSGNPQQVNRPDERIEIIEIVYKGTVDSRVRQFIDQLESLIDLTVFLNMDQQTIPGITFTANGVQTAGSFVLDIDPVNIPIGSRFSYNDIDYWVTNRDTTEPTDANILVLSRKLVDLMPGGTVIKIFDSPGQGEFQYLQQENKKEVQDLSRIDNTRSGLRLMFIRKKI